MLVILKKIYRRIEAHALFSRCAEASYYLFLSFFPFLMLLAAILSKTSLLRSVVSNELGFLPEEVASFLSNSLLELSESEAYFAVPFSVVTLLWSSSRGVFAVSRSLRFIYGSSQKGGYITKRLKGAGVTLLLGVVVVFGLFLAVFGKRVIENLNVGALSLLSELFMPFALVVFFNIIYKTTSPSKPTLTSELSGAIFASSLWTLFSYAYSCYVDGFSKVSLIYGSAASVVLLLLWLNFCIFFLFLGAELNVFLKTDFVVK